MAPGPLPLMGGSVQHHAAVYTRITAAGGRGGGEADKHLKGWPGSDSTHKYSIREPRFEYAEGDKPSEP